MPSENQSTHDLTLDPATALTPQQRYQREVAQSDKDHHTPTAGAMTGHIIANLFLDILKIRQARWFAKGSARLFLTLHAGDWIRYESTMIERLDAVLISDNEMVPTTSGQLKEYGKLEEDPARKYAGGGEQLNDIIHDFDWQMIFVSKATALANNEGKPVLSSTLSEFHAWANRQIMEAQLFLGNDPRDNLYQDEDDDDEDSDE